MLDGVQFCPMYVATSNVNYTVLISKDYSCTKANITKGTTPLLLFFFFLNTSWHLLSGSLSRFVLLLVYRLCSLCLLQHRCSQCVISFFPSPRAKMDLDLVSAAWAVVPGESFSFVFCDLFWLLCCWPGPLGHWADAPPWRLPFPLPFSFLAN